MEKFYIGNYYDENGDHKLDLKSLNPNYIQAVHQFYDDMTQLNIADGSEANNDYNEQLFELTQSDGDIMTISKREIEQLYQAMQNQSETEADHE